MPRLQQIPSKCLISSAVISGHQHHPITSSMMCLGDIEGLHAWLRRLRPKWSGARHESYLWFPFIHFILIFIIVIISSSIVILILIVTTTAAAAACVVSAQRMCLTGMQSHEKVSPSIDLHFSSTIEAGKENIRTPNSKHSYQIWLVQKSLQRLQRPKRCLHAIVVGLIQNGRHNLPQKPLGQKTASRIVKSFGDLGVVPMLQFLSYFLTGWNYLKPTTLLLAVLFMLVASLSLGSYVLTKFWQLPWSM